MFITAAAPAVVIGGAVVVVGAASAAIRYLRSRQDPSSPSSTMTVEASTVRSADEWEGAGKDWDSIREDIVHGDPFSFNAVDAASFTLTFVNERGIDAVDVVVEFREFDGEFSVEEAPYQFDRLEQGVPQVVAIEDGAAVQGRIPVWLTYSIDGDPESERHMIDSSVLAFGE